jgi:hypothetical protein
MLGIVVGHGRFPPRGKNTVIALSRQQYGPSGLFLCGGARFTMV